MSLFCVVFVILSVILITMDTNSNIKAVPLSELLPALNALLPKDSKMKLTAKKQPRQTIAQPRTTESCIKPLTMAEMKAELLALKGQTPKHPPPVRSSTRKKIWNSSVKVDKKTISHTADKSLKNNPVRKFLNFQSNPKAISNIKATTTPASPKFHKPEFRAKKSVILQAKNNVRISGISSITETPVINNPIRRKMSIANKENILLQSDTKKSIPCSVIIHKKLAAAKTDTPMSNDSWKSSCDASFLQKEKDINDAIEKAEALIEEKTLENIAEVTPPASTPFREYRSIQEFFNTSNDINNSTMYQDNTIMEFEEPAKYIKREDSVIVSLCDLLNKTKMNGPQNNTELEDLLQIEKQIQQNIIMIENFIEAANKNKQSQLTSLNSVKKLIKEKANNEKTNDRDANDKYIISKETKNDMKIESTTSAVPDDKNSKPSTVITLVKSPSYKVPKKNTSLRKKVYCKSMPNISSDKDTPVKDMGNRALSVYMKMKQHMNFLNTPVTKRHLQIPDTPGVTSHNLQKQLNKLYGEE